MQQAIALLEEAVLGVHEGQHLGVGGGTGGQPSVATTRGPAWCTHIPYTSQACPCGQGPLLPAPSPITYRIQDFKLLLGLEDVDLQGDGGQVKGVGAEVACDLSLTTVSSQAVCGPLQLISSSPPLG